jgi:hypothetical protein
MPDRADKKIRSPARACGPFKGCKEPWLRDWVTAMQIAFGYGQNIGVLEIGLPSIIAADDKRVILQKNGRDVRRMDLMHGLLDNPTDSTMWE